MLACGTNTKRISHILLEYYSWLFKLNIWQRLIEAIQELICLKGVLMIEIGIHLVDPITFMDDVKSAITLANTRWMS